MKEKRLGIINLIADHILDNDELKDKKNDVVESLISQGYNPNEIIDAFTWIRNFAVDLYNLKTHEMNKKGGSCRVMCKEESMRFTVEGWGFLIRLTETGVIDDSTREEVIHKALSIIDGEVDLDDVMIIASLVIFRQSCSGLDKGSESSVFLEKNNLLKH